VRNVLFVENMVSIGASLDVNALPHHKGHKLSKWGTSESGLYSCMNTNNHYIAAHEDGTLVMDDDDPMHHDIPWYIFKLHHEPEKDKIALYNWQNKSWLASAHEGHVTAKNELDHHCEWELTKIADGYALKAHHGKYLVPTGVTDSEKNPPVTKPHVTSNAHHSDPKAKWIVAPCAIPPPRQAKK